MVCGAAAIPVAESERNNAPTSCAASTCGGPYCQSFSTASGLCNVGYYGAPSSIIDVNVTGGKPYTGSWNSYNSTADPNCRAAAPDSTFPIVADGQ